MDRKASTVKRTALASSSVIWCRAWCGRQKARAGVRKFRTPPQPPDGEASQCSTAVCRERRMARLLCLGERATKNWARGATP